MSNTQKVAVVTGASQGIGKGVVAAYRARGWQVVAISRSIQPSSDPDVLAVTGDIGDPATGKQVVADTIAKFGRIDSLQ